MDSSQLQRDFIRISDWALSNGLEIIADKSYVMSFYRSSLLCFNYFDVNSKPLNRVDSISDLGVLFDSKLSFSPHVKQIHSKAINTLGSIRRGTH